jgi:hypothetical protein
LRPLLSRSYFLQLSKTRVRKWLSEDRNGMRAPACSTTALRRMGFAQSLHCTTPISDVLLRGSAPNIFMSRAESHEVGGGKAAEDEGGEAGGGLEDSVLNEKGAGDGVGECLSLRRTAMRGESKRQSIGSTPEQLRNIRSLLILCLFLCLSESFYHSTVFSPYFHGFLIPFSPRCIYSTPGKSSFLLFPPYLALLHQFTALRVIR